MKKILFGDEVEKIGGYKYPGVVVGVIKKLNGDIRYVVECTSKDCEGMLHIFNDNQLKLKQ